MKGDTELLIITGMSGAGRSTVAHSLEDLGWYVVDNLPPALLSNLIDLIEGSVKQIAVVIDVTKATNKQRSTICCVFKSIFLYYQKDRKLQILLFKLKINSFSQVFYSFINISFFSFPTKRKPY